MREWINQALEEFAQNPGVHSYTLRELLRQDRDEFYRSSLAALQTGADSPGHKYLLTLLVQNGFVIDDLANPAYFSAEVSVALARRIATIDPQFDTKLARLLPGRNGVTTQVDGKAAERVLDLLEATSSGARIVPLITHLMQGPDARLRAKAALVIGRRVQNARATEALLRESDPRMRASVVESLWGADSPSIRAVLWQAAKDSDSRVVGNALYGLYLLQDQEVIPLFLKMAFDEKPAFRVTAGWAMGETADPRFLRALERLSSDLYAQVRSNAAKGIARIRAAEEAAVETVKVDLQVLRAEKRANGARSIWVRVAAPDGGFVSNLAPTDLTLWEDEELVVDYQVAERRLSKALAVGFALCAESGIPDEFLEAAGPAVIGCLEHMRGADVWAVAKMYSADRSARFGWHASAPPESDQPVGITRYLTNREVLQRALDAPPLKIHTRPAALEAVRNLLPGAAKERGQGHLIVLAGAEFAGAADLKLVAAAAIANEVSIHAVVAGEPQATIESFCRLTGGTVVAAPTPKDIPSAYQRIYLGMIDRYEITFRIPVTPAVYEALDQGSVRLRVFSAQGCGECRI